MSDNTIPPADLNTALNLLVLTMLNEQVKKVCFNKCFPSKFDDKLNKNEQICIAKCMDRMYEAHTILSQAVSEASKNITNSQQVESLFGKVCAIDGSFWISHCLASESNMRHGGDIVAVFFLRICYLLDRGIKPVFVFDGCSPFAKMKTIIRRKIAREKSETNHKLMAFKLLALQMKNTSRHNKPKPTENDRIHFGPSKNFNGVNSPPVTDSLHVLPTDVCVDEGDDPATNSLKELIEDDLTDEKEKEETNPNYDELLELFSEEFDPKEDSQGTLEYYNDLMSSTDVNYENEISSIKNSEYLSNKTKFELMNAVRERFIQDDMNECIRIKDDIDQYSNYQIKSYIRGLRINNEIEGFRSEVTKDMLNIQHLPGESNIGYSHNTRLGFDFCNYNRYFGRKLMNNLDPEIEYPIKTDPKEEIECIENKPKELVDKALFETDDDIFGKEFMSDINEKSQESSKNTVKNDFRSSDTTELNNLSPIEITSSPEKLKSDPKIDSRDPKIDKSHNNYFLALYRKYFKDLQMGEDLKESESKLESEFNLEVKESEIPTENNEIEGEETEEYITESSRVVGYEYTDSHSVSLNHKHPYYENIHKLLDHFGVPYIVAPSEAESQCAYMNRSGKCYAVISDDSDSLVFGAKCLLKNFYNDKVFELYKLDRIRRELGIGRKQLALIAIICGCDYTNGVKGIGIVNALEVIKAYPTFEDLYDFRDWATSDLSVKGAVTDECPIRKSYKLAHVNYRVNWTFSPDFPNREAYNMFLNPSVTDSYKLEWRPPDVNSLISFMGRKSILPLDQVKECLRMLSLRKSQQFIIEDIMPEIRANPYVKSSLKNYRKTLNTNLSAFRKALSNIKMKSKFNVNTTMVYERNHTLSKIRSKRMKDSIKVIRSRGRKKHFNFNLL
ncbi:endonuclease (xp-g/RAD2 homologue), putative [Theileria annulata]|uniref:Endonuclease (Xp-g/RAD2 homologue), putative n=1 Tax=Theileria annulata TaxID=5874 RepID=Q4U9E4_THEAN|nr:endonuclease (xp-g/RAD2 homologue), putative [Theileria annulata]CAI76559.1 endonuclease (xp-g/RAD2 homologue), putative [Theileria annulata]|eukprot:XP_953184.1 endonuclease (xp-g/RAD2 homologue), putative [Theileria annulata]